MANIIPGIIVLTLIVMVLVLVVTLARRIVIPTGSATLVINGKPPFAVALGEKLLPVLAAHDIYLPAACGGRGTCGQCRVSLVEGGGELLPIERSHINRNEAAAGVRLACQLVVKRDIEIRLSEEFLGVEKWTCSVCTNRNVSTFMKELVLALPTGEHLKFAAGSYVLIHAPPHDLRFADFDIDPDYRQEWERHGLFAMESHVREPVQRAYSMANPPQQDDVVMLVVRIATPPPDAPAGTPPGQVSSYIFGLEPGDEVVLSGPFGHFRALDSDREMVFIGGGAGIAPLRSIIFDQLIRLRTRRKMSFWYGSRSLRDLCYQEDFETLAREHENFSFHVALSEPKPGSEWKGPKGFIHKVVYQHHLKDHPAPEEVEYYLCGPPVMSTAVIGMLEDLGVPRDSILLDDFGAS
jgi:Na+-transporting NADH:ubiquinone oxidoreductase subunit F